MQATPMPRGSGSFHRRPGGRFASLLPRFQHHLQGRMTMIDTLYDAHYKSREKLAWEFAKILNQEAREL